MRNPTSYAVKNFDRDCDERKIDAAELPRDVENDRRALAARETLRTFVHVTGTDLEDALSDIICDLMHFADRYDFDFDSELTRAELHYRAEIGTQ